MSSVEHTQRNWVLPQTKIFLIPISLQPDDVNLDYFISRNNLKFVLNKLQNLFEKIYGLFAL